MVIASTVELANELHKSAWGRDWPGKSEGTTESMVDISRDMDYFSYVPYSEDVPTSDQFNHGKRTAPTEPKHTHPRNTKPVVLAYDGDPDSVQDVLVRREYEWLRNAIEFGHLALFPIILVVGQKGIGMTIFLFYVLLSRLRRRLNTAIQLTHVTFDDHGLLSNRE